MAKKARKTKPDLQLLTDQSLCEAGQNRTDGLGFDAYASVLANAAVGTPGPFTIGVFGEWGTGKTSLLRMVEEKLDQDEIVTVWFNAWQFEKEPNPIIPLIGTILHEIERRESFRKKLGDQGKSLIRALRSVAYGLSASAELSIPGLAKLEAGFVAKDMIDREEALTPDPLIDRSLYYRAFEALEKVPLPEGARVVVLIDDLDRCFPDKAIRLLESIKLVLAQRGFIFFLGVARTVLEGYLEHRYEEEFGIHGFQGTAYLDKIVQLAFPIPPHTGRMEELARGLVSSISGPQAEKLAAVVPLIAEHVGPNPRALVRFINNLLIDVEISKKALKEEVPLEFFAITRCLQLRWRSFFEIVVMNDPAATLSSSKDREDWTKAAKGGTEPELAQVAKILLENPTLSEVLRSPPGLAWLDQHETRKRAVQFLRSTSRTSMPANGVEGALTLAYVLSKDPDLKESLVQAMRDREAFIGYNHRTFPWSRTALISRTKEDSRLFFSDGEDPRRVILLLSGPELEEEIDWAAAALANLYPKTELTLYNLPPVPDSQDEDKFPSLARQYFSSPVFTWGRKGG